MFMHIVESYGKLEFNLLMTLLLIFDKIIHNYYICTTNRGTFIKTDLTPYMSSTPFSEF